MGMGNIALIIIDVQHALVINKPYAIDEVINNIKRLLNTCRDNKVEIIYIQHNGNAGGELEPQSDGWQIYDEIRPKENEKVIFKNYNSAFRETKLNQYLYTKDINQLIITGMQTEYCIDTTCKVAFEYGYKLIIPEKTNTTYNNGGIKAKDLYKYYNYNIFNGRFGIVESTDKAIVRITKVTND